MHPAHDWLQGLQLHGLAAIVAGLVVAYLIVAEPFLGRAGFRRFLTAVRAGDDRARVRFYRQWTVQSWLLASALLALSLTVFGWTPAQLGLRLPRLSTHVPTGVLVPVGVGALIGLLLGIVMARYGIKRQPSRARPANNADVMLMLPRTPAERRGFALLAVTAGITEEVVWRGILLAIVVAAFPGVSIVPLAVGITLAFGWAHLYQGPAGIVGTALLGGMFTALYLLSGSLLLPIVLHAAVDLLAMLRAPMHPDPHT